MAIAVGIKNCALKELFNNNGASPNTVVIVVSTMGLKRETAASFRLSKEFFPSLMLSLYVDMRTNPLFIKIPHRAIIPSIENILTGIPWIKDPQATPTKANGR